MFISRVASRVLVNSQQRLCVMCARYGLCANGLELVWRNVSRLIADEIRILADCTSDPQIIETRQASFRS